MKWYNNLNHRSMGEGIMAYSFDQNYWQQRGVWFESDEKLLSVACFYEKPTFAHAIGVGSSQKYFVLLTNKQAVVVPYGGTATPPKLFVHYKDLKFNPFDGGIKINSLHIFPDLIANKNHNLNMNNFRNTLNTPPR